MTTSNARAILIGGVAAIGIVGCNNTSGPKNTQPVSFHLAVLPSPALAAGAGPLEITSFRLVLGPAALGSGDQFGCVDCQDRGGEVAPSPQLISVPTDGSPVMVANEQVAAGSYTSAEIELLAPDRRMLGAAPGWPASATVEVSGKFTGAPFTLHMAIPGAFRETLNPPVDLSGGTPPTSINVTVTIPVASWFTSNGGNLDPSNPTQASLIEQNARSSFQPIETGQSGEGT